MKFFLALLTALVFTANVKGQVTFAIIGTVKNERGEKLQSATVFIAGTEKVTSADNDGQYKFSGLLPGNYLVVVNMLGYNPLRQMIVVKNRSQTLDLVLNNKEIALNEVVIATQKQSPKDMKKFTRIFLGSRYEPKLCKIINPEHIHFGHTDSTLTATSDDFLIIENRMLGYRVKYLLASFYCRKSDSFYFFDGEYTFEPLTGSAEQQRVWDINRRVAYDGSMMHFLRALYAGTTRKEGFLVYKSKSNRAIILEANPSDPQQYVTHSDTGSAVTANIDTMVLVVQNKEKAAKPDLISDKKPRHYLTTLGLPFKFTLFKIASKVDSRGSVADRKTLYIYGYWGVFGISDMLPFEYNPK